MKLKDWYNFSSVFWDCLGQLPLKHLLYLSWMMRYENPQQNNGSTHINAFFPPYPSLAFDQFLRNAKTRTRTPYSTYFAVTDQCPYNCNHCSYGKRRPGTMNTVECLDIINQIKMLGTPIIGFTGGEPLMRDDLSVLLAATGDDVCSTVFTTGYSLSKQKAEEFRAAGLDVLMIGIESDSKEEHDNVRRRIDSFDAAIYAINTALEAGIYTGISTMATKSKVENGTIERLCELANKLGIHEFRVLEPVPTGRMLDCREELITEEQNKYLIKLHKKWNSKGQKPSLSTFSHLESNRMFGCGTGFHHLYIDSVGNVCPCDLNPIAFGNVRNEPLKQLWDRMGFYFPEPSCGCFARKFLDYIDIEDKTLPLKAEDYYDELMQLAEENRGEKLPKIYENYLRR